MKAPHRHAELIKAWADGAEIQFRYNVNIPWSDVKGVCGWDIDCDFRIKPEPKPDFRLFYLVTKEHGAQLSAALYSHNLVLNFDGETGKLKSAEVL